MDSENSWAGINKPEPEAWRDSTSLIPAETTIQTADINASPHAPNKLLELLGKINYKILSGDSVYLQVRGTAYKVIYGAYWRSVFTGAEHFLLRCEELADGMWIEGSSVAHEVDLPICNTKDGWFVDNYSLQLLLYRDAPPFADVR